MSATGGGAAGFTGALGREEEEDALPEKASSGRRVAVEADEPLAVDGRAMEIDCRGRVVACASLSRALAERLTPSRLLLLLDPGGGNSLRSRASGDRFEYLWSEYGSSGRDFDDAWWDERGGGLGERRDEVRCRDGEGERRRYLGLGDRFLRLL